MGHLPARHRLEGRSGASCRVCGEGRARPKGWRCFDVRELHGLRTNEGGWTTSRDDIPQDCVDSVDVEAAPPPLRNDARTHS